MPLVITLDEGFQQAQAPPRVAPFRDCRVTSKICESFSRVYLYNFPTANGASHAAFLTTRIDYVVNTRTYKRAGPPCALQAP